MLCAARSRTADDGSHRAPSIACEARTSLSLTQGEAAALLDVTKGSISRAENDPSGRFLRPQRRMIEELAGWELEGPFWKVTKGG